MRIVETGAGYVKLEDCISNLEDRNPHDWYDVEPREFAYKGEHQGYKLYQFDSETEDFYNACKEIDSDLKELGLIPQDCRMSKGLHEVRGPTGSVPIHHDQDHIAGLTVFLNQEWPPDRGGWNFCLDNDDEIIITPPKFNTGIIIFTPRPHGSVPVWHEGDLRRTLQIFFDET